MAFNIFFACTFLVSLFRFGHVFLWDSGSSVGTISGHSKLINAIAYRPERPFRVVTAGEDKHVNIYEGPPFKYKASFLVSVSVLLRKCLVCILWYNKGIVLSGPSV